MTFEEAKKIFLNRGYVEVPGGTYYYDADKWRESITVISKWLEQEPCEDAVSRQAAILQVQRYGVGCFDAEEFSPEQCERFVIQKLNDLPSVTPKEKSESEHDHEVVKAYNDGQAYILDKIRAEIEEHAKINQNLNTDRAKALCWCLDVINKYKTESEE